nr:hypothetical protein [Herbaspirillum sp. ASV7]
MFPVDLPLRRQGAGRQAGARTVFTAVASLLLYRIIPKSRRSTRRFIDPDYYLYIFFYSILFCRGARDAMSL